MGEPDISDLCQPIKSFYFLMNWKCDGKCWIHKHNVVSLNKSTNYLNSGCVLNTRNKTDVFSEFKLNSELLPKTIFCHDYKGGYVEDRFCNGSPNIETYRFFNWAGVDMFIYFSHHLVTIPTQGWLNAGHSHGVPVLGTLITEWEDGEKVWKEILTDIEKINLFSLKLAEVCAHFKFDGYLLNVENKVPKDDIPRLVQFVALLKAHLQLYCGKQTWVIWYDSVTTDGHLQWQNKLCPLNKPFFDACDGIFLNYVWKPADLLESLEVAGPRRQDVYVGVDVWGRNCYQNGGFSVDKAMTVLRSLNMSVALFAPAWTFEAASKGEDFLQRETQFWSNILPYLYIHGPAALPFHTNFCQGISFDKATSEPLFNLGMQQYQPTAVNCSGSPDSCVSLYLKDGLFYNGACLKISACSELHSKTFHRVLPCDFSAGESEPVILKVTLAVKNLQSDPASKFRIYFVFEDRASIEGRQAVSMITRPKGYRATATLTDMIVTGSVMDFTAEKQTEDVKIKVLHCHKTVPESVPSLWHEVKFMLELNAGESLTEILLLPAVKGSVLWGILSVERSFHPVSDNTGSTGITIL